MADITLFRKSLPRKQKIHFASEGANGLALPQEAARELTICPAVFSQGSGSASAPEAAAATPTSQCLAPKVLLYAPLKTILT